MANAFLCQSFTHALFLNPKAHAVLLKQAFTESKISRILQADTTHPIGCNSRPASRSSANNVPSASCIQSVKQSPWLEPCKPQHSSTFAAFTGGIQHD